MRIFVAAAYSAHVNYETREVNPEYKEWLEGNLTTLEGLGHTVFCALRTDGYKINDLNPAEAFSLDEAEIDGSDALLAFVVDSVSAGVQTEIGMALGKKIPVVIAHEADHDLAYFNAAIIGAGHATEIILPIRSDPFGSLNNT